jgi:hypothetical protein
MPVKTPNNFFAEDKYGPITDHVSDATTFAQLKEEHEARTAAAVEVPAPATTTPERPKMSRTRKAVGAALLTATVLTVPQTREVVGSAASAVVEQVGKDRIFHPEQGNPEQKEIEEIQRRLEEQVHNNSNIPTVTAGDASPEAIQANLNG